MGRPMQSPQHQIALTAFSLGIVAGGSLVIAIIYFWKLAIFSAGLATFHFLEFYWQSKFHPQSTTHEGKRRFEREQNLFNFFRLAFLLDHSPEYTTAIVAGMVEMALRSYLASFLAISLGNALRSLLTWCGCLLMLAGLAIRSVAMIQAATNFSHDIRFNLKENHQLVTGGIYRYCRHPSYLGFAAFAIGAQLVLGNLVCFGVFVVVLRKFFAERIRIEEVALLHQYPKEYAEYRLRTPSGIPGIK
jgi:protein-S-isoprenylcysteine O-methyltransferase